MPVDIKVLGQQASPLDRIASALQIARSIQGMQVDSAALEKVKAEEERLRQANEDARNGVIGLDKQLEYGSKYNISDSESPNAIPVKIKGEGGALVSRFYTPKPSDSDGLGKAIKGLDFQIKTLDLASKSKEANDKEHPENVSLDQRLAGLKGEQKARFDNARMGLNAVAGMQSALAQGQNTFSLIGDNDFTRFRRDFEEAIGRMQSGGAISSDEEKRFRTMAPTKWDSKEVQEAKLAQLSSEMGERLKTLGVQPEEVSKSPILAKSGKEKSALIPSAMAGGAGKPTAEDFQALQWAKSNMNDPRAKSVLQTLKAKGLK